MANAVAQAGNRLAGYSSSARQPIIPTVLHVPHVPSDGELPSLPKNDVTDTSQGLISLDDVRSARATIRDRVHRTPTSSSAFLSNATGLHVSLKLELFQKTGSFKVRGVLNALHHLGEDARRKGVISLSAGNHAQALAWGAAKFGIRSTIVMPTTATRSKVDATREYGGEVVQTDGDLLATALEIQRERDLTLVHPFDDLKVIAGQGTVGLEILEDVPDADVVVVGCGGGGLLSGIAGALKLSRPAVHVIGIEPAGANAMQQSIERGEPVRLARTDTIADGLAAPFAGQRTLHHVRAFVDQVVTIDDREILHGMRVLMQRCKIVPEPAGAAATGALLAGRLLIPAGARVVSVVSGGNIDLDRLRGLL
jgi:threonine dehydratase